VELKANWLFQITEGEGRRQWLRAVDRFVLFFGAAAMLVIPFPLEARLLGWRAVSESALFAVFGLLCYEGSSPRGKNFRSPARICRERSPCGLRRCNRSAYWRCCRR
jgi:hypothetical protein